MSNEGTIKTSLLLILLKCIVGYSNGSESLTGELFSNYELLNKLFQFFRYLSYSVFHDICQKVCKETILFELKFKKSISRCSILQVIRMSNFVMRPFEYKLKKSKNFFISVAVFSEIKNDDILNFSWIKYFGNDFLFLIK